MIWFCSFGNVRSRLPNFYEWDDKEECVEENHRFGVCAFCLGGVSLRLESNEGVGFRFMFGIYEALLTLTCNTKHKTLNYSVIALWSCSNPNKDTESDFSGCLLNSQWGEINIYLAFCPCHKGSSANVAQQCLLDGCTLFLLYFIPQNIFFAIYLLEFSLKQKKNPRGK